MFILKHTRWLDGLDPYGMQRVVFQKALFIATIMTFVYWFAKPNNLLAFFIPLFVTVLYENVGSRFREKEKNLLFIYTVLLTTTVSFYLIYPFKLFFLFYAMFFLTLLYFITLHYYSSLKNGIMFVLALGSAQINNETVADLQTAYNICSSMLLSMGSIFFCLKIVHSNYDHIWRKAAALLLSSLEQEIESHLQHQQGATFFNEVYHLNVMRCYCTLFTLPQLRHTIKITNTIRNIQFSINNIPFDEENPLFWQQVKTILRHMEQAMLTNKPRPDLQAPDTAQSKLQRVLVNYLTRLLEQWNKLCATHD